MKKLLVAAMTILFAAGAYAQAPAAKPAAAPAATPAKPAEPAKAATPAKPAEAAKPAAAGDCEARAVSKKDGKPLAGAAKAAFMKKCEREAKAAEGKQAKTKQQEKMKSCNAEAKGKKGDERKKFMKECLAR